MNKELILRAFVKASQELYNNGVTNPSLTQMSTKLSHYLEENWNVVLGERSLRIYRGDAQKLDGKDEDISIKQIEVINGLCQYLGYENYNDFQKAIDSTNNDLNVTEFNRNVIQSLPFKYILPGIGMVLIVLLIYNYSNKQRWMVWQTDHYVEVDFDATKYNVKQLKLYREEKIKSFKKVEVNCYTDFFNEDNSVRIWYGKNSKKQLEYFTNLGLHPETGITLKPITSYMINKYVCFD
ncbi:hypothetical protein BST92_10820 [Nonlabens arenilitoris]|uniref:Uncharacterized protein n=1 Tax=Nonlabens arenilitoris TaxID=1217969 RepID=A0A2S7UBS9_9FLAO|nr:hypothetical protein [Nonlabens arenilitoris]PQJ32386.1 hypothetical protein BST92_10820 [Nonlabens arenilitoris]